MLTLAVILTLGATLAHTSSTTFDKKSENIQQAYKGYPSRTGEIDIRKGFANPPKGYGNVPFYWWSGDSLRLDRLNEQLEILADASTDGLCVSYNHTNAVVDTLINAAGHGFCGRVQGGTPRVLSAQWRDIWNDFSEACAQKGIGLGMDDYVVAWPRNGEYIDSILALPQIKAYQGRLHQTTIAVGTPLPEHVVRSSRISPDSVEVIHTTASPELHPELGHKLIDYYFNPFVEHMTPEALHGMNYFFQDELDYNLNLYSWCEDMPQEFLKRKGYDIVPLLPMLFGQGSEQKARVRLDYAEVVTQLAEERYFQPIYHWHADKGLIYGSDNQGRGLNPTQYLDYFRASKWYTAPGNDAPSRGSSFNQTKVSSSVAHLYKRPRTWLEAFHSMGWDANGALLTHQLDHHIIAGGNLLCMHGLYYSTHGGWWEWAPPCFHFHMPYWEHMKVWLKYAERMCFVLSQGVHVCDVAVLYPTETMQAYPGTGADATFAVANALSPNGVDFDFIDFASLQDASINDSSLCVADERYRVLVLAETKALHEETLQKIIQFADAGGTVVALDNYCSQLANRPNVVYVGSANDVLAEVRRHVEVADFRASSGNGRVLHRKVADHDVYMVMDVSKGDELFFRAKGKVEIWDAQHGTIAEAPILRADDNGTWVRHDGEQDVSRLYVFSPGIPTINAGQTNVASRQLTESLDGLWDITIVPTLDNRWGDFRLPATPGCIGVEARGMSATFIPGRENLTPADVMKANKSIPTVYGYGPYMLTHTVKASRPVAEVVKDALAGRFDNLWEPYVFSWQYGVFGSPGSQGYHGLKAKVDSRFLILDQGGHQLFTTQVYAPTDDTYRLLVEGIHPYALLIDGKEATTPCTTLTQGWHKLLLVYDHTEKTAYTLQGMVSFSVDPRNRSMVMLYPQQSPDPQAYGEYADIVASKWYGTSFLPFDVHGAHDGRWLYHFSTAPGTVSMHFAVNGRIDDIWVDGQRMERKPDPQGNLALPIHNTGVSDVYVLASPDRGYSGTAFFAEPVAMTCQGGRVSAGDWTQWGAMRFYSGGVRYRKQVDVRKVPNQTIQIDLGAVDATCEVAVNGRKVDVLINKPYKLDITRYLCEGENTIEILVYSALSNHYQTIPSPYQGVPHAGLIGPVRLIYGLN
ncbi:MAG: glycosyl hydrolase [Bacteroidales bacterium]|nr:glycosyl hydrolase [Bacteroidales bacterium]